MSEYETIAQLNSVEILPPPSSSFVPLPKSAKCNVNSDIWRQKKSEFVQINGLERNSNNDYAVVNNSNISNSNSNLISVNKYFDINKFEKNAKIGADTTSLSDSLNKPFIEIGENGNIPDERPKKKTRARHRKCCKVILVLFGGFICAFAFGSGVVLGYIYDNYI